MQQPQRHDLDNSQGFGQEEGEGEEFDDFDVEMGADDLLGRISGELGEVAAENREKLLQCCKRQAQEWITVTKGKVRKKPKKDL